MESLSQQQIAPPFTEKVFAVMVLLLSSGAFMNLTVVPDQGPTNTSGMLGMQLLWTLIYALTLILFLRHCRRPFLAFFEEVPLVVLCALAIASTSWSQAPALTFRRSVALLLTVLFGIYFAKRFRVKEQLRLLALTCWTCIVFSLVFGVLGLGTPVNAGDNVQGWYGIFVQKNVLGRMMVLSGLVFLLWKRAEPEHKWLANAGLAGSVLLIALSQSMTSMMVLVLLLVLFCYLPWALRKSLRSAIGWLTVLFAAGLACFFWVATHIEQVANFLGRSVTLTGRLQIWILSAAMAIRRPWLGYGYDAFWLPGSWATQRIWLAVHWAVPHAHNGLLELWLELGIVGASLFMLVFCYYLAKSIEYLRHQGIAATAAWPLMFMIFMFLSNLTESDYLARNTIYWILFIAVAVTARRGHLAERRELSKGALYAPLNIPWKLFPSQSSQRASQ